RRERLIVAVLARLMTFDPGRRWIEHAEERDVPTGIDVHFVLVAVHHSVEMRPVALALVKDVRRIAVDRDPLVPGLALRNVGMTREAHARTAVDVVADVELRP